MKTKLKILMSGLFALSFLPGCYTMLKHPDVSGKDEQGAYTTSVYFYDDCATCHTGNSAIAGNFIKSEDLKPVNTYDHGSDQGDSYYEWSDYYGSTPYYIDQYYGDYGYYYHRPWWYDAAPVIKERITEIKKIEASVSKGRDNDGGRNDRPGRGGSGTGYNPTSPGTAISTGTSTGSSGDSGKKSGSTDSSRPSSGSSDRGNSTSSSSSSGNDNRSSSGSSGARNNDSQRSTSSSGRR